MVRIYTLPTCGICRMIKIKMQQKNIQYEELNLENTPPPIDVEQAPILQVNDKIITTPGEMVKWINEQ